MRRIAVVEGIVMSENDVKKDRDQRNMRKEADNGCCGAPADTGTNNENVNNCCCGGTTTTGTPGAGGNDDTTHDAKSTDATGLESENVKRIVRDGYARVAKSTGGCCGGDLMIQTMSNEDISRSIGYSDDEINTVPDANLGLGCGNPTALSNIKEGDVVVDLGSGAGFDSFLAAKKLNGTGKVIGVDMTPEMIEKARDNARNNGFDNVEFRLGDIEDLPIEDDSVDVIISNCVINLAPDKLRVFREAFRVLRPGGRIFVSDIVLLKDISASLRKNAELITCCVGGALLKDDYLEKMKDAGFRITILGEDTEISKRQYHGIALESIKVEGIKD